MDSLAAAFGRLCVETIMSFTNATEIFAAAFGRLCVETTQSQVVAQMKHWQPPSGGCVLKHFNATKGSKYDWAAAFGRLCVETNNQLALSGDLMQPPSGGCVLKR